MRTILHSDCNNFYASVESALNPKLKDKAIAVSGNVEERHGIILAKNELAKKYGVKTGEAIWQAKKKCPELITLPPNFELYMEVSKRIKEIYYQYTDRVESFGLDEAWLDVTGSKLLYGDGFQIAETLRERIKKEVGITISVGVSFNKIFAKLGSDLKKPDATTVITKENFKKVVWPLPANYLLYVGRATNAKLKSIGIYTIGSIANCPIEILRTNFYKWGDMLYSFANGYDLSPVAPFDYHSDVKSIGNSTTSMRDLCNNEDIKIIMHILVDSVCRRMREKHFKAKTVTINVRDKNLLTFTRQLTLPRATNVTTEIFDKAMGLFYKNYNWESVIRSIGVSLSDFSADTLSEQISLFQNEQTHIRQESLDTALDSLKEKYGHCAVLPAILLKDLQLAKLNPKEENVIHPVGYF